MTIVVELPNQFRAQTLFRVVEQNFGRFETIPKSVNFDFSKLRFARPSGMVFLSNLTRFLARQDCKVCYINADPSNDCIRFMDDSLFFEQHVGSKLNLGSTPRQTTRPLMEVKSQQSHAWIGMDLIPWMSNCSGVPERDLMELKTCVSELFNNISDHAKLDVGSVFAQWFPQERQIEICVADIGEGIPKTISRVESGLSDIEAIKLALEDGFTSKSLPTNQGAGLFYLQQNVVENLSGQLHVQSAGGAMKVEKVGNSLRKVPYRTGGYCPGTLIEMRFGTDLIEATDEIEDFQW